MRKKRSSLPGYTILLLAICSGCLTFRESDRSLNRDMKKRAFPMKFIMIHPVRLGGFGIGINTRKCLYYFLYMAHQVPPPLFYPILKTSD
jgi:hypothetical protein